MSIKKNYIFDGDNIIIFGGTGTIGSIFADVLLEITKSAKIYLATNNEFEIWEAKNKYKNIDRIHIVFSDIRDREETRKLFINLQPGMIINCAALKHVNYCEDFVMNAIKTNIMGLENLLYLSNEYDVKWFIQVSTDKAVEPISVMGATKMLGERLCREWDKVINGVFCIRLGNVVDSRGSLIPTLYKQIQQENEVCFTDEKMYRYLITIEKLKEFIEVVFDNMGDGSIFIPKLKEKHILEFINEYLEKFRISENNIRIKKIGRRKGEKYREKLFSEYENIEEYDKYYRISW